ncbi:MAG: regulator of protease activity HflC (stomatin/prohibitin superfamily) [Glaciecola sp.]|jgi:regulator of protease activity HflC (stomatin/prohibitin superfamily)
MNPNIKTVIPIVIVIIVAAIGMNSYTTVSPGHNKVATLFGDVREEALDEGFHIVNPLYKFYEYDLRVHTETWTKVQVPSQDKLKTSMDISVTFRINPTYTSTMLKESGSLADVIIKLLTPKVRSLLREAGKTVEKSQDFYLDTVQQSLQLYMEEGLTDYMSNKGLIVEAVLFRDITLPQVVTSAVVQTKERQEQLEREKAQLSIVEQQAQQQVKQAEAREQAAKSDANAIRTLADAQAYQIGILAESQAVANTVLAKSVTRSLIDYNAIAKWNGEYPQTLMGGGPDSLILQLPGTKSK